MYEPMEAARKITVQVPQKLLRRAQESTGRGITTTIRQGLELVAAGRAYEDLRKLKGKVSFSIDLDELRRDRTGSPSTPARSLPISRALRDATSIPSTAHCSTVRFTWHP